MDVEKDNISICSQVEEVIKCAICWETPSQPKILPCQHSFCLRCIEPVYFANIQQKIQPKGRLQCPMCRYIYLIPKKGLVALPPDRKTNVLTDIVLKKRNIQSIQLCSICKVQKRYTIGTFLCVTCCMLLCSKCHSSHKEASVYKEHVQVSVYTKTIDTLLCTVHTKEFIQYYCTTCELSICKGCAHGTHSQHSISPFVASSTADLSLSVDTYKVLQDLLADIPTKMDSVTAMKEINEADKTGIANQLAQLRSNFRLSKSREKALRNCLTFHQKVAEELDAMEMQLEDEAEHFRQCLTVLNSLVYPVSGCEDITPAMMSLKSFHKQFTSRELFVKSVEKFQTKYFQYISDWENIPTEPFQDHEQEAIFADIPRDELNSRLQLLWKKKIEMYDVQFLRDGSKNFICTQQSSCWKLQSLDFAGCEISLPDYLKEFADCQCRIITNPVTSTLTLTHRTPADGLILPFSTFTSNGTRASGTIRTSRDQISLCSIACTRKHDVIFTFMANDAQTLSSIRRHSPAGEKRWYTDTSQSQGAQALSTPYYAIVDYMDRIIISDYIGARVNIYDSAGEYLLSFPKPKDVSFASVDDPPRPSGICVDSKNCILVAFPSHSVISKFSPNGDFLNHILSTDGQPRSLSLLDDRFLAVGELDFTNLYDLDPEADRPIENNIYLNEEETDDDDDDDEEEETGEEEEQEEEQEQEEQEHEEEDQQQQQQQQQQREEEIEGAGERGDETDQGDQNEQGGGQSEEQEDQPEDEEQQGDESNQDQQHHQENQTDPRESTEDISEEQGARAIERIVQGREFISVVSPRFIQLPFNAESF